MGAVTSPVYTSYGTLIAQRSYRPAGFTTALGRKDLHLALDVAATTDTEVAAVITNTVTSRTADPGFAVRKQLSGDAADTEGLAEAQFTVNWTTDTSPAQTSTLTITGAGVSDTVNLPPSTTVTLTEAAPTAVPDGVVSAATDRGGDLRGAHHDRRCGSDRRRHPDSRQAASR